MSEAKETKRPRIENIARVYPTIAHGFKYPSAPKANGPRSIAQVPDATHMKYGFSADPFKEPVELIFGFAQVPVRRVNRSGIADFDKNGSTSFKQMMDGGVAPNRRRGHEPGHGDSLPNLHQARPASVGSLQAAW